MVIAITLSLGKGFWQIFIAVGLTMWVEVARVVRGQVISARELEYVQAGKILGDMAAVYFVSVAAIVAAFYGKEALAKKSK